MARYEQHRIADGKWFPLLALLVSFFPFQAIAEPVPGAGGASHLRLERVISDQSLRSAGRKIVRWLTGEKESRFFGRPYAASWDGSFLVVADPGASRVLRIAPRGKVVHSRAGAFESPVGVAVCPDGIVVADSRSGVVSLLDRDLRRQRVLAENLVRPTGVTCGDDRVFVAETGRHRIAVLNPREDAERDALLTWGSRGEGDGEFNFPTVVTWDGESLWVGDTLNFRIQQFDGRTGRFLQAFGRLGDAPGEMPRTKGIALDSSGKVWVSDAHLDKIALFRNDGTFLAYFGGNGSRPGQFSFPAGLAAHEDGRIAVVDSLNRRIQIFRLVPDREVKRQ